MFSRPVTQNVGRRKLKIENKNQKKEEHEKLLKVAEKYSAYALVMEKDILDRDPENIGALMQHGITLVEMARYGEAKKIFHKLISLAPEDKLQHPYAQLGHLYYEKRNIERSIFWYKKAVDKCPDDATYKIFLGAALAKKGNFTEALRHHRAALKCKKGATDEAYLNIGYILRAQEKFEEAKVCFEKALEIDSDYKEALKALEDVELAIEFTKDRPTKKSSGRKKPRR